MDPSVYSAITRMAEEQGINPAFALAVAERESRFDPYAHASQSIFGIYQMSGPLRYQYGSGNSADPYTQASAWGRFINQTKSDLANRIGREPTDTELYYAHHFGPGRAAGMINGNYGASTPVSEVFTPYELSLNPHLVRAGTVGNVMGSIGYDMDRRMSRYGGDSGSTSSPQIDLASYGRPLQDTGSGGNQQGTGQAFDISAYGRPVEEPISGHMPDQVQQPTDQSQNSTSDNFTAAQPGSGPANGPDIGNPLQLQRPGTEVDLSGLTGQLPTAGPNPAGITP